MFYSTNESKSGQRRSRSDCADAQYDLGLRYPHMLKDTFSHGAAHDIFNFSDKMSLTIKKIISHFKDCEDLKDIILPEIVIGKHTYGADAQKKLFLSATDYMVTTGGNYCRKNIGIIIIRFSCGS